MYIYILELENGKYYIGRTNSMHNRINMHRNNNGSIWTKMHKVISIIDSFETNDPFDEDKYVKKYMKQFGINNVRGGSYSLSTLSKESIKFITQEIYGATDKCFKCGCDHFIKNCNMILAPIKKESKKIISFKIKTLNEIIISSNNIKFLFF